MFASALLATSLFIASMAAAAHHTAPAPNSIVAFPAVRPVPKPSPGSVHPLWFWHTPLNKPTPAPGSLRGF